VVNNHTNFYGTRIFIEADVDGDPDTARETLLAILETLLERDDIIACVGEVGPEGDLDREDYGE
jgi:hypothetical protein